MSTFVFYRVGNDDELAAEVAQDAFVTALDRTGDFDPERGAMSTRLTCIARNRIRSALEGRRVMPRGLVAGTGTACEGWRRTARGSSGSV